MDLFKAFKHEAHLAKNGYDLSQKHVFSSKAGQQIPCCFVETVPGDQFKIDVSALMRTMTFDTAAFVRGKQHYDFFFVPYSQLWHPFNQFISQKTDSHSTLQKGHLYCPVFDINRFVYEICNAYYNGTTITTQGYDDIFGYNFARNVFRMLDMCGYGNFDYLLDKDDWSDCCSAMSQNGIAEFDDEGALAFIIHVYVNPFRLAAYQHIWYDFYRNKYFDNYDETVLSQENNYVSFFNFDDIQCTSFANSVIDYSTEFTRLIGLCQMRYRQWQKDIFTSVMPSQQFGVVSSVDLKGFSLDLDTDGPSIPGSNVASSVLKTSPSASSLPGRIGTATYSNTNIVHDSTFNINKAFDVLQLKKSEYLQQWKQNALRAGNMVDENFKSHFGVEPYYESDNNVDFLGSFSGDLLVNSVEATTQNTSQTNNKVGDLGATGTSLIKGSQIDFKARDYGVIVCVASYVPQAEYMSDGIDKANTLYDQFDFFTPEFQNIGLEAVPYALYSFENDRGADAQTPYNKNMGYAPRYWMYKTAIDKVHGQFSQSSLAHWVAPRIEQLISNAQLSGSVARSVATFYVNPNVYDNVFSVLADSKYQQGSEQITDYLLHNVYFDIKAVRPMSVLGLPQF